MVPSPPAATIRSLARSRWRSRESWLILACTQANMSHDSLDRQRLRASDLIVAAGGDGTIRLVLGAVAQMKSSVPVSIMPLGTGNQLARNLAIYEENILT